MSYYCTNCGAKLENGATQCPQCGAKMKYCPYCGSKFDDEAAEAQSASPASESGVEAAPVVAVACSQLVDGIQGEGQEGEGAPAAESGAAAPEQVGVPAQAAAPEQVGAPAAPQASASVAPASQASASAKAASQPAAAKGGTAEKKEEKEGHGCLTVFLTVLFTIVLIVLVVVVGVNVIGSEDLEYQIGIAMLDWKATEVLEDEDEVVKEITWGKSDAADALPVPDWAEEDEDGNYTLTGQIISRSSSYYYVYAQIDSKSDYNDYVSACKEAGYTIDAVNTGNLYFAESDNGYQISIRYYGESSPYNIYDDSPMIRICIEEID